ncbi:hypothetical protein OXPF_40010 [Oxobacter pfennigii]|uniref:Uncharacterized protein n=1 Tax=Oxobacter pfennigii TaxID=36849 RepID=A0A0P8WVE3_9CLOT|nr:hypothetical protein OXPF_40010 [Oxobacter pfennigii]
MKVILCCKCIIYLGLTYKYILVIFFNIMLFIVKHAKLFQRIKIAQ